MPLSSEITAAVECLRKGGIVGLPTETVYGLAADAENPTAVLKIFSAKGRPTFHPLIVHLPAADAMQAWAVDIPPVAWQLAERFWPGPLTLILRKGERVPGVVTGDLPTVGLRVPAHPVAQEVLRQFGGGLAAPSANRFGRVSPTTAAHVREELGGSVDLILDGGPCDVGLESTIVDLSSDQPAILRPGAITAEQLSAVLPRLASSPPADAPHCSGRLASHYAPQAAVEIISADRLTLVLLEPSTAEKLAVLSVTQPPATAQLKWFPMSADPATYARQLYATLREVDRHGAARAFVVLPGGTGVGAAIADRVRKAAAPRP